MYQKNKIYHSLLLDLRAAWHTNWMNFSWPEDRDSGQVNVSPFGFQAPLWNPYVPDCRPTRAPGEGEGV